MHVINLDEETGTRITLLLVKNVKNIESLRKKIIAGSLDCCAIKPCFVVDPLQIAVAANKAAISKKAGKLTTKSVNSELLYNLSVSKNITQSLNTFGIDDKTSDILIVVFEENGVNRVEGMKPEIEGELCDIGEIKHLVNAEQVKKIYKIKDSELKVSTLLDSVISRIAVKDFGSH